MKKILFIMNNLNCGGAEKALVSLLKTIDYSKYEVDLLLFKQEGIFLKQVPKQVNILPEPFGYKYYDMSVINATIELTKNGKILDAIRRLRAFFIYKSEKDTYRCGQKVWPYISKMFGKLDKKYDVAIGYLENNPIYYCIDNVYADKKIGFIHNDYDKLGLNPIGDRAYFNKLDNIVTVSEECAEVLKQRFPEYKEKVRVMYNIVSPSIINDMAKEKIELNNAEINLVTVGRLNYQKGYDMAIEACKKLIEKGYDIKWNILGEGKERVNLENLIKKYNLEDRFILLGIRENPYPYILNADIYVQTSRFEGKSIAIDEAKILNKPILVTDFTTVRDQISDGVNGLIVDMNVGSIVNGLERLIKDNNLKNKFKKNLSKEELGTEKEIKVLYDLCN